MRHNISEQLQLQQMDHATAGLAESEFHNNEMRLKQQEVKEEFDQFGHQVMSPSHAFLSERITKANACVSQLKAGLTESAQDPARNELQGLFEEGDERPELLEKLNLMKWLFDSRETLYREVYDLENARSELFRKVVTTPMSLAGELDRLAETNNFFESDSHERRVKHENSRRKRAEEFLGVIESNVTMGAERLLSALYDIAPALLAVVQKVPQGNDLAGFEIRIPPTELEENPSYHKFPMQYLYTLLIHTEKSTYSYIESMESLNCLLHEAQMGSMLANLQVFESTRLGEGGEDVATVSREMEEVRRAEEAKLTADLKERVALTESQWRDALGLGLVECKERVQRFLVEVGGWDDSLLE